MNTIHKHRMQIITVSTGLLIIGILVLICLANLTTYQTNINADIASEALLCREIWLTRQLIPSTWYPSTELRIIGVPNLASLFYGITENMSIAMGIGCILMTIITIFCIFFFGQKQNWSLFQCMLFTAFALLLPGDNEMQGLLYLYAGYYISHTIGLFLTLGFYARILQSRKSHITEYIIGIPLALLLGIQGARAMLVLYAPLLCIELLHTIYIVYTKHKAPSHSQSLFFVLFIFTANYIGMKLPISPMGDFSRNIRNGFSKLIHTVLPQAWEALAIHKWNLFSKLFVIIVLLMMFLAIINIFIRIIKKETINTYEWCYLVICSSPFITMLIMAFTTIDSSPRYYFMLLFAIADTIIIYLFKCDNRKFYITIILTLVLLTFSAITHFWKPLLQNNSYEENEAITYLKQNNIHTAYCTFDFSNTLTVLSNGEVQISAVNSMREMQICKWLSSQTWYLMPPPTFKICCLFGN